MADHLDTELSERLRANGQRVTSQRVLIHRLVRGRHQHVTAEQVHAAIADALPGVSIQTVYSTLELFEELGVVRRVPGSTSPALFDSRLDEHHHAVCASCGDVSDLTAEVDLSPVVDVAREGGLRPAGATVLVSGLCAACAAAQTD